MRAALMVGQLMRANNGGHRMKIAIIEDDEGVGFSLRLALEDKGHSVEIFADPTTVPYASLVADVILVDFYMPKMDGEQVIRRLQAMKALEGTKILLMSASLNLEHLAKQLAVSYIAKPFDLDTLFRRIEV
jgi:DNA-binding response OmpR family regulator